MLNGLHAQPVATIDQWRSSLELADEVAKVFRLAIVVQLLDRALRHDGGLVCVHDEFIALLLLRVARNALGHGNAATPFELGACGRRAADELFCGEHLAVGMVLIAKVEQ